MKPKLLIPSAAMVLMLCTAACQNKDPAPAAVQEQRQPLPASGACQPVEELAALDHRTPVPLQPMMAWHQKQNMMEHLVAIQRITDGLAREDWDEVASASALIESSPQMQQMCQHMGAGAQGFTEMALEFHRRADAIGVAARAHDGAAVLRATSDTLQSCTDCHTAFRQEVVSATEWQQRTGSAHQPAMMHGEH
ncbi:MAG TPA: hypothetical protein RMG48_12130 [Myxococcales bacterium LLY-WYZ-16_1]|jgi:hypothetical protein|nr:hypothetical protein [Myxococcales bacterium LLY-WYZ-16_1]